jgi:hypothetical protein
LVAFTLLSVGEEQLAAQKNPNRAYEEGQRRNAEQNKAYRESQGRNAAQIRAYEEQQKRFAAEGTQYWETQQGLAEEHKQYRKGQEQIAKEHQAREVREKQLAEAHQRYLDAQRRRARDDREAEKSELRRLWEPGMRVDRCIPCDFPKPPVESPAPKSRRPGHRTKPPPQLRRQ